MPIEVRGPEQRFRTDGEGRATFHAFSFGAHYDPHNVGFGALIALNDERLDPGAGYPDHPHGGTEIVTWVLAGSVLHRDSVAGERVVLAGQVGRLGAGTGVVHSEIAGSDGAWFVQSWIRPDEPDLPPAYDVRDASPAPDVWTRLAGEGGVPLAARGVAADAARMSADSSLALPDAPRLHVTVLAGEATLGERTLTAGAAARLVDEGGRRLTATGEGATVLVWSLP